MEQTAKQSSMSPQSRSSLPQLSWQDINEAGAYVEVGTGDLFRIPQEALVRGASPLITKESAGASRFVKVSANPYVITLEARRCAAQHNIEPNF